MAVHVFYQNVRGLRTKLREFGTNCLSNNHDILCITESWLNGSVLDSELVDLDRYSVFRRDRETTKSLKGDGGGVMIAVSNKFEACVLPQFQSDAEDLWIRVSMGSTRLLLCCVYLPPGDSAAAACFTSKLNNIKGIIEGDVVLICGDFNCSGVQWISETDNINSHLEPSDVAEQYSELVDTFTLCEFMQFNNVTNARGIILDLVFCNQSRISNIVSSGSPLVKEDGHHPSIEFLLNIDHKLLSRSNHFIFNFKKANYDIINEDLSSVPWSDVLCANDVDVNVCKFYEIVDRVIANRIPKKKVHSRFPSYFAQNTIKIIKQKNKYHKKWKIYKNIGDYLEFKRLRALSKVLIHINYNDYLKFVESELPDNPKLLFNLTNSENKRGKFPSSLSYDGVEYTGGEKICSGFAEYFRGVFVASGQVYNASNPIINNSSEYLSDIVLTERDIEKAIGSLDQKKGAGPDGIPSCFVGRCPPLCVPLKIIFNQSLRSGVFPRLWRRALVVPIPKGGDKSIVQNYRPISKLCIFSKLLEKFVYSHLLHLVKGVIIPEQHGFIGGKSIETNLLTFVNFLEGAFRDRVQVDAVYTDFSKAFDKISHQILVRRLSEVGVAGSLLRWCGSYLTDRTQFVAVDGYKSDDCACTSGVPQGSHLGPLFFLIYINNVRSVFQKCKILLYADDLKIFCRVRSVGDCLVMQREIYDFEKYCDENFLFLNLSKCQTISFTRNVIPINFSYSISGTNISKVDHLRDLGVTLDRTLKFSLHVEMMVNSANRMLGYLFRQCRVFKSGGPVLPVYYAYVFSRLNFASVIWNPQYKVYINRIERVQNKMLKYLSYKSDFTVRDTENFYFMARKHFNIISLEDRRKMNDVLMMGRIMRGELQVSKLLQEVSLNVPVVNLRNFELFHIPFRRTNFAQNSPLIRMLRACNELRDVDIFHLNHDVLKKTLKRFFLMI